MVGPIYRRGVIPDGPDMSMLDSSSSEEEEQEEVRQEPPKDRRLERITNKSTNCDGPQSDMREKAMQKRKESQQRRVIPIELPAERVVATKIAMISSEDDSDSESEEEEPVRVLLKPQQRLEKELLESEKERLVQLEIRKKESSDMVVESLRKDLVEAQQLLETFDLDDTDDLDIEQEKTEWKLRELLRIKRDREQREYRLVDEEDILRRRNLTDDQIENENKEDGTLGVEKIKLRFMQKYYHKGAFYTGDAAVDGAMRRTDSAAPTLEDHQDKTMLPSVMQVKKFGMAGRTKYTHLVDQDTTGMDAAWAKPENISLNILKKMGGSARGFEVPAGKKKKA